jgi:hypothetical protein
MFAICLPLNKIQVNLRILPQLLPAAIKGSATPDNQQLTQHNPIERFKRSTTGLNHW